MMAKVYRQLKSLDCFLFKLAGLAEDRGSPHMMAQEVRDGAWEESRREKGIGCQR